MTRCIRLKHILPDAFDLKCFRHAFDLIFFNFIVKMWGRWQGYIPAPGMKLVAKWRVLAEHRRNKTAAIPASSSFDGLLMLMTRLSHCTADASHLYDWRR